MCTRSRELVTANGPAIVAKSLLDAIVVEDRQRNRCLPNTPCADESGGREVFGEANDPLDQFVTSEEGLWLWWW